MNWTLCSRAVLALAIGALVQAQQAPDLKAEPTAPELPPQSARPHYAFKVWHDDYPVVVNLPAVNPAPVYVRSRRQSL